MKSNKEYFWRFFIEEILCRMTVIDRKFWMDSDTEPVCFQAASSSRAFFTGFRTLNSVKRASVYWFHDGKDCRRSTVVHWYHWRALPERKLAAILTRWVTGKLSVGSIRDKYSVMAKIWVRTNFGSPSNFSGLLGLKLTGAAGRGKYSGWASITALRAWRKSGLLRSMAAGIGKQRIGKRTNRKTDGSKADSGRRGNRERKKKPRRERPRQ